MLTFSGISIDRSCFCVQRKSLDRPKPLIENGVVNHKGCGSFARTRMHDSADATPVPAMSSFSHSRFRCSKASRSRIDFRSAFARFSSSKWSMRTYTNRFKNTNDPRTRNSVKYARATATCAPWGPKVTPSMMSFQPSVVDTWYRVTSARYRLSKFSHSPRLSFGPTRPKRSTPKTPKMKNTTSSRMPMFSSDGSALIIVETIVFRPSARPSSRSILPTRRIRSPLVDALDSIVAIHDTAMIEMSNRFHPSSK
eukprot:gene10886-biopygen10912